MAEKSVKKSGHHALSYTPASKTFIRAFMAPFKFYFSPQFYGLDELDVTKPAVYVSNHTILGILDGFPFAAELYLRKGIMLRALADRRHFAIPVWRDVLSQNFVTHDNINVVTDLIRIGPILRLRRSSLQQVKGKGIG